MPDIEVGEGKRMKTEQALFIPHTHSHTHSGLLSSHKGLHV